MLTAIDQIANRTHLQIIKATVPYLPESEQKMISCLVKVLELRNVVRFFSHPPFRLCSCEGESDPPGLSELLNDIRSCCDEKERQFIDQFSGMMNTLELYAMMAGMEMPGDGEEEERESEETGDL